FTKPFSEKTAQSIDSETKRILTEAEARARKVITTHRAGLEKLAQYLLDKETIFSEDLEEIFGAKASHGASRTGDSDEGPKHIGRSKGEIIAPETDDTDEA
ncbi:MAG: cell division protein FtsH, partial [Alistipes sp.]|nr:cell division protein FtsH [Alistipes sp.]